MREPVGKFRVGAIAIVSAIMLVVLSGTFIPAPRAQSVTPTPTATAMSVWPMFHHDLAHTGLSQYDTSGNNGSLKWKLSTGNFIYESSPSIGADNTIYIGSEDDYLYAVNSNGTLKWKYSTGAAIDVSSPAVDNGGVIYVGSTNNNLYAVNSNGTLKWMYTTGGWIECSPTIGPDGTILVGSDDGNLYAINPDGTLRWFFSAGAALQSSPAVAPDGTVYVGSTSPTYSLYAVNSDGTLKWKLAIGSWMNSSPAIGADGTVFIGGGTNLYAVNPDGTPEWTFVTNAAIYVSSPAIGADGTIYIGSTDDKLYAVNRDGTLKWSYVTGGSIYSSPVIGSDGSIYVGSDDSNLYALNPDGSQKWIFPIGNFVSGSSAIGADGTVYVGSQDHNLYAIGAGSGPPPTKTVTASPTLTVSRTATLSPTGTLSPSATFSATPTVKPKPTRTLSPTLTSTPTATFSPTASISPTVTVTPSQTATSTGTAAPTPVTPSPSPTPTACAIIHVPSEYPTIQAAISAAATCDTVEVEPGTYFETINFSNNITVTSTGGPDVTIIDGSRTGAPVVTFPSGTTNAAEISGFTITSRCASIPLAGGGISVLGGAPTISGNVITDNCACGEGGGIAVSSGSPIIESNVIANNAQGTCTGGGGGGIYLGGAGSAALVFNTIYENSWKSGDGGGIWMSAAGTPFLMGNLISHNSASGISPASRGGGIATENNSNPILVQNVIAENTSDRGGGLAFSVPSGTAGPLLVNNTIAANFATQQGSAVYFDGFDGTSQVINNLMIGSSGQSALYCDTTFSATPPVLKNNDAFSSGGSGFQAGCAGAPGLNGNISADPAFVDPRNENFELLADSPAIDAGLNSAPDLPAEDYFGNPRILDGNTDGNAVVDMGAAEFTPPPSPTATSTATTTATPTVTATPTTSVSYTTGGSTTSLNFPPMAVGDTATKTLTIMNTGASNPLFIIGTSTSDPEYAVASSTCPPTGLAPGGSCTIGVSFTPNHAANPIIASLTLSDNTGGAGHTNIPLAGSSAADLALAPSIGLSYPSLAWGTSSTLNVTIENFRTTSVTLTGGVGFTGLNGGDFSVVTATSGVDCGGTAAAGSASLPSKCNIGIKFTPGALGAESAILNVSGNPDVPSGAATLPLTAGTTIPATVNPPLSLIFGSLSVSAHASQIKSITITNSANAAISIGPNNISGGGANYSITGGSCPDPGLLAGGSSCTINVTFAPTVTGSPLSGSISVADGPDFKSPRSITLLGNGVP
ncbi:MAG TPA: PQQ-binding-like beta-propeller repeat protein [Candidatus Binataceae bacterium]|nr:PQQ-binding-like beta-propeller repeat protein [Candidatus Binataceae bacterium]